MRKLTQQETEALVDSVNREQGYPLNLSRTSAGYAIRQAEVVEKGWHY